MELLSPACGPSATDTPPTLGLEADLFALDATLIDLSPALFSAQPPYRYSNPVVGCGYQPRDGHQRF